MIWIVCMMTNEWDDEYSHEVYFEDAEEAILFAYDLRYSEPVWKKYDSPDYVELVGMYKSEFFPYLNREEDTNEKMYGNWDNLKQFHQDRADLMNGIIFDDNPTACFRPSAK